jgi:murein DD-endopeptidase MepM/ murein hydrolase activator NlpD
MPARGGRGGLRRYSAVLVATLVSSAFAASLVVSTAAPAVADSSTTFVFPYQDRSIVDAPAQWSQDQGVDIADRGKCGPDAVLVAVSDGVVTEVTDPTAGGFGPWFPVILASDGPFAGRTIYYGHTETPLVAAGDRVVAGQPIARVGCGQVGISDGPHLEIGVSTLGGPPLPGWHATSQEMLDQLVTAYNAPPDVPTPPTRVAGLTDTIGAPYQVASGSALQSLGVTPATAPDARDRKSAVDWSKLRLF